MANEKIKTHWNIHRTNGLSGIDTYTNEIAKRLIKYDDLDVSLYVDRSLKKGCCFGSEYTSNIFDTTLKISRFPTLLTSFHFGVTSLAKRISNLFQKLFIPKFISYNFFAGDYKSDIYMFFANRIPFQKVHGKIIACIHDVIPLVMDDANGAEWTKIFRKNVDDITKRSDKIITVSEYSKQDIIKFTGVDADKIEIVYSAAETERFDPHNAQKSEHERVKLKYNLPDNYILYVGDCRPRKNVESLVKAYALLSNEFKHKYKLVITNPSDSVKNCIRENNLDNNVCFVNKFPEEDKPALFQMADLFAWLSFYEGFGIPILEAMASGVPVVCSNRTSMPEVAGDAAIMIDPENLKEISNAIEKVLTDENLRADLISKGYENIKRFSWEKSAQKLHDVIVKVMSE